MQANGMMMLGELLQERKDAVIQRWLDDVLATYPEDGSRAFERERDPFANPVGHNLRKGTRGIFEALLNGMDKETIGNHLIDIIKIRAVQQFSASQAVAFVFSLKGAIRRELADAASEPAIAAELLELEEQIDRIALAAFDIFLQCREQLLELRINEVKRSMAWTVERLNRRDAGPELTQLESGKRTTEDGNGRREGVR
jgi:hypothetical protein